MSSSTQQQRYFENRLQPLPTDDETLEQAFSKLREAILVGMRLVCILVEILAGLRPGKLILHELYAD